MQFLISIIQTIKKFIIAFLILSLVSLATLQAQAIPDSVLNNDYDSAIHFSTDTSIEKHIYDTSQNFFNQKDFPEQPYANEKIQPHHSAKTIADSFKNAKEFWYVKAVEKFKANEARLRTDPAYKDSLIKAGILQNDEQVFTQETNDFTYQPWFKIFIWAVIIGVFLFGLVYFLMANKIGFFSRSNTLSNSENASNDIAGVNIFQLPYHDLLQRAYHEKNYRLAVRILYLQTLKLMSERSLIQFQPEYTNLYYLNQLHATAYYDLFFTITRNYEYVWYGKFEIAEPAFNRIKQDFAYFQNKLL